MSLLQHESQCSIVKLLGYVPGLSETLICLLSKYFLSIFYVPSAGDMEINTMVSDSAFKGLPAPEGKKVMSFTPNDGVV